MSQYVLQKFRGSVHEKNNNIITHWQLSSHVYVVVYSENQFEP